MFLNVKWAKENTSVDQSQVLEAASSSWFWKGLDKFMGTQA